MHITKVWPFLNYICCCLIRKPKPKFNFALKKSLRRKLDMPFPKSEIEIENDPFLRLGK